MRQGNDVGTQYRSAIYTFNDAQRKAADASKATYQKALGGEGAQAPSRPRSQPPVRSISPRTITSNTSPRIRWAIAGSAAPAFPARSASASARLIALSLPASCRGGNRSNNHLLTITGAKLEHLALRDGSGAGCARVSIACYRRHDRACAVGLHAPERAGGRSPATDPRQHGLWRSALRAGAGRRARRRRGPLLFPSPMPRLYLPVAVSYDAPYHLDAGDKLRVVVYGQEGLTNTYAISAGGTITMPLIGSVPARGRTPSGLAADIAARLRNGFIREPSVAVEVEAYRPFFILGEVQAPGQYPYVPNMTAESAVAIAGGFSPRAKRDRVTLTHTDARQVPARDRPAGHADRSRLIPCSSASAGSDASYAASTSSYAWRKIPGCAARRCRRWPCRSLRARRNESRAVRRDRCRPRPPAASP